MRESKIKDCVENIEKKVRVSQLCKFEKNIKKIFFPDEGTYNSYCQLFHVNP